MSDGTDTDYRSGRKTDMMNWFEMPEMNAMMAEDVSEPSLRSLRSREKAVSTPKKTGMGGLWNENFERMFSRR